jgi:transcriptional regulator with XRE-family HTH domain
MHAVEHEQQPEASPELAKRAREWSHAPKPACIWVLGRNLARWRKRNRMSYKRLAEMLGCRTQVLSRLEKHPLSACRLALIDTLAERTGIPAGVWMTDGDALPAVIAALVEIHSLPKVVQALGEAAGSVDSKPACAALPQAV